MAAHIDQGRSLSSVVGNSGLYNVAYMRGILIHRYFLNCPPAICPSTCQSVSLFVHQFVLYVIPIHYCSFYSYFICKLCFHSSCFFITKPWLCTTVHAYIYLDKTDHYHIKGVNLARYE